MVVELIFGDKWEALAAERLPQAIDDATKEHRWKSCGAAQKLSPEELREFDPGCLPETHQVKGCALIAKFPVD
eukprot:659118-Pyramimonas_sp.AAC.1